MCSLPINSALTKEANTLIITQMELVGTHTYITVVEVLQCLIKPLNGNNLDQFKANLYSQSHHQDQSWTQRPYSTEMMEQGEIVILRK